MLHLPVEELHFWWIDLSADGDVALLSLDEQARANRLVIPQARQQFIAGRVYLRQILSQYLQTRPQALTFEYGTDGKPALKNANLHFNFAHSEDRALLAVSRHPVGVDLERIRPVESAAYIANTAFTPAERELLAQLPPDKQTLAFFRLWTCKEAAMKALGGGFRLAQQIEIHLDQNLSPRLVRLVDEDIQTWTLETFAHSVSGFAAAYAVKKRGLQLRVWGL